MSLKSKKTASNVASSLNFSNKVSNKNTNPREDLKRNKTFVSSIKAQSKGTRPASTNDHYLLRPSSRLNLGN